MYSEKLELFRDLYGGKFPEFIFKEIYKNAKTYGRFNGREYNWKKYYLKSHGRFSNAVASLYRCNKILDKFDTKKESLVDKIVQDLRIDGYSAVPNFLSSNQIKSIKNDVLDYKFFDTSGNNILKLSDVKKRKIDLAPRYTSFFGNELIKKDTELWKLIINPFFADISQKYFEANTYVSSLTYMYSPNPMRKIKTIEDVNSATSFHFDYSHFKFLKFFIYLTDVETIEDGPHVYIKKTHGSNFLYPKKKSEFKYYRFHENGKIEGTVKSEFYESKVKENIVTHFFPAGSLIIEDTSGMHRGSQVSSSKPREMLSLLHSISNYGGIQPGEQPMIENSKSINDKNYLFPILEKSRKIQEKIYAQENLLTFSSVLREKYYALNKKLLNINFKA